MTSIQTSLSNIRSSKFYGFGLVIAATALFSSKAVFIKVAYGMGAEPDILMALRMLFSMPLFILVAVQAKRAHAAPIPSSTLALTAVFGICGYYLASVFDLYGLQYISASLERIILYTYPTIVVILSAVFLGASISRSLLLCIGVIYCGLLIVFVQDLNSSSSTLTVATPIGEYPALYVGATMILISALMFSIYLIGSEYIMRTLPSRLYTATAMLAASFAIAIHFLLKQPIESLLQQSLNVYLLIFIIAIFCTVLPSFLLSAGIQSIGASTASAVGSLGPIATLVLADILLDESVTKIQLIGFSVVIIGVISLSRIKGKQTKP